MGSTCSTTCCASKDDQQKQLPTVPFTNVKDMYIPDEQELRKLESMINAGVSPEMLTTELCGKSSQPLMFQLLKKSEKTLDDYETLAVKDSNLAFNTIDADILKYMG